MTRVVLVACVAALVLATAVGCRGNRRTQKEQATADWNKARASVLTTLAHDQYRAGNYDKCELTLADALKLDPTNPALHILAGRVQIERNNLDRAERSLQLAIKYNPDSAEAHYLTGVVYQRWQKHRDALGYYELASIKAPGELAYVLARSEMHVALGQVPAAVDLLESKVPQFEHSAPLHDALGLLYAGQNDHARAVEHFRQASILQTDDKNIREHLATSQYFVGQYREAAESLSRLMTDEPFASRTDLLVMLGECQMRLRQYREAKANFEAATMKESASPAIWRALAKASLKTNDLARAELAARKSQHLDPASTETQLLMGYVRLKQNRHAEALEAFKKAAAMSPADTTPVCMIGYTYGRMGQGERAMQFYAKALRLKPNDPLATRLMASVDVSE